MFLQFILSTQIYNYLGKGPTARGSTRRLQVRVPVRCLQQQPPATARAQLQASNEALEATGVAVVAIPATFQSWRTGRSQIRLLQVLDQVGAGRDQIPPQELRDWCHSSKQLLVGLHCFQQSSIHLN